MTIAWAIIIVAVLFLLHKHKVLGKTLRISGIVAVVLIACVLVWAGWNYIDSKWKHHQFIVTFAKQNECLDSSTGAVHPVNESGEPWCKPYESIHERGTPIDQWAIVSESPTVPPGDYYAIDGESRQDGLVGAATAARLCVNSNGVERCYVAPSWENGGFGLDSRAREVKLSTGGRLILFTAEDYSADSKFTAIALLANNGGKLDNLLPVIRDPADFRLWDLPVFSSLPVLIAVHSEWDMSTECHACPHRYTVMTYLYKKEVRHYVQVDHFWTAARYEDSGKVFDTEKTTILAGLQKASEEEASRHVTVKDDPRNGR